MRYWARALRDPILAVGLAVDLVPIAAVLYFGWGAAALVMLYWVENLVIGLFTLFRIILAGVASAGTAGLFLGAAVCAFFIVHYGMFCTGHGFFLLGFIPSMPPPPMGLGPAPLLEMVASVFERWPTMPGLILLIAFWQAFIFVVDDLDYALRHGALMSPIKEMFAPYGRIILLHIGVFAGAFALISLGDPMIGVLALILARGVFGMVVSQLRRTRLSSTSVSD